MEHSTVQSPMHRHCTKQTGREINHTIKMRGKVLPVALAVCVTTQHPAVVVAHCASKGRQLRPCVSCHSVHISAILVTYS